MYDRHTGAAAAGEAEPPRRPRRWRRRGAIALAVLLALYAALWIVRLVRDYEPVAARIFFAGPPLVFAHRGASAISTEHTYAAYRRALADGADVLELDVRRARDGALVVSHDADLRRALGVPLVIADQDLVTLRGAVARRHPGLDPVELLPTLEDVMAAFPGARLNVELKTAEVELADAVASAIERAGRSGSALVASFHGDALGRFRRVSRRAIATAAAPAEGLRFYLCYLLEVPCRLEFEALQVPTRLRRGWPELRLDGRSFIRFAHRHGLEVHYWTIDDEAEIARLLRLGADGIMTNDPARAVRVRRAVAGEAGG